MVPGHDLDAVAAALFDGAPFGVAVLDADVRFRYVNRTLATINGLSPAEHLGRHPREALGPVVDEWVAIVEEVLRTGHARPAFRFGGEQAVAGGFDGATFEVSYHPVLDDAGGVVGVTAMIRDVTAVVAAERRTVELSEAVQQDRFRRALDAMLDDVAIGRPVRDGGGLVVDFELVHANHRSTDGAGRAIPDLVGRRVLDLFPMWKASGLFDAFVDVVETGRPYVVDALHYADEIDGVPVEGWYRIQAVPFGEGYLAITRDVTEEVRAGRELEDARVRLSTEREAVRLLQEVALPVTLPSRPGVRMAAHYRPADQDVPVGGDWYDAFELPDGRVALAIGDVAGHGRDAAVAMVRIRTLMATIASHGGSPSQVLEWTHQAVGADSGQMATAAFAVVDPAAGIVTVARAGHLPMIVVGPDGEPRTVEVPGGLPIGVGAGATFEDAVVPLTGASTLVLITDGVVERRRVRIDDGIDALRASLRDVTDPSPEAAVHAILDHLERQVGDVGPLVDDACVLVCRVDPAVATAAQ